MINMSLSQRITFSFILIILMVGLLIGIIYPISLKSTLTEETYRIIEVEQERITNDNMSLADSELDFTERKEAERSVGHLFIINKYGSFQNETVPNQVIIEMEEMAFQQLERKKRYELTYMDATLFYVINKIYTTSGEAYHISFMWDTYRDEMVERLWGGLFYILIIAGLLSLIPAYWLKSYLKQPLLSLGSHFEQIAERNWQEPFTWKGDESFEKLSHQFEKMRQNLIHHDRVQKTFMQHASHELKTPIMVIKSYAKSIKDGITPKEDIEKAMDVILEESERMEKRVKDMLYYTKLDSFKELATDMENFPFGAVAYEIGERFRLHREDISIIIEGDSTYIFADKELIRVLLENLVENALRYAVSHIELKAEEKEDYILISVKNDGEKIPQKDLEHLFNPFRKGNKGQYGLGLAIVNRISEIHGGYATVNNEEDGVRFSIAIAKKDHDK